MFRTSMISPFGCTAGESHISSKPAATRVFNTEPALQFPRQYAVTGSGTRQRPAKRRLWSSSVKDDAHLPSVGLPSKAEEDEPCSATGALQSERRSL